MKFSDQVVAALRALHPDARKEVRRALDDLSSGKKRDVAALDRELSGFWRLRVCKLRVVFRYDEKGQPTAEYLGPRSTVYKRFGPSA